MAKVIICPICGRQFETSRPNKKFCSFSCREAGQKLRRMKWEAQNPDYSKKYMQEYRKNQKEGGANNEQ